MHGQGLPLAVHGSRLEGAGHSQRLVGGREHDQQQQSRGPAVRSPHSGKNTSTQCPVASRDIEAVQFLLADWQRGTGCWQLLYHFFVQDLAKRLLKAIRKQGSIRAGDCVAAAVSGGADSVALLCLLLELRAALGIVLSVAHVNHKLRGEESEEDERFVTDLAQRHKLELHVCVAPVTPSGTADTDLGTSASAATDRATTDPTKSSGIEASARQLRYGFFRRLAQEGRVTKIATAHTLDDQAETVLMRVFRGTGIRGLSGIHPRIKLEDQGRVAGEVVRPLLSFRRATLQHWLRERSRPWREDLSNQNVGFLRNRVRHRLLPLIAEEFGEAAVEHMAELAEIARAEEEQWAGSQWPGVTQYAMSRAAFGDHSLRDERAETLDGRSFPGACAPPASLDVQHLLALPLAAQRRVVRAWLEANGSDVSMSFRLIEDTLEVARAPAGQRIELPGGRKFLRQQVREGRHELCMEAADLDDCGVGDYEYRLMIPGSVDVPELRTRIEAQVTEARIVPEAEQAQLLDMAGAPKQVVIRNWRAGDRYWPAHTAAAKKVKELLSRRHATGAEKKLWPVAVAEGHGLIWMRGFSVPEAMRPRANAVHAIWIREIAA